MAVKKVATQQRGITRVPVAYWSGRLVDADRSGSLPNIPTPTVPRTQQTTARGKHQYKVVIIDPATKKK